MNTTFRMLSLIIAVMLCFGLAACGGNADTKPTDSKVAADPAPTTEPAGTEPFVAPPDALGKIVAADATLITWNAYATEEETIDFMGVDTKKLGDPDAEMTLYYLEEDVTYYTINEGKLVAAAAEDMVPGSIVGVTTLEEGVQEVYIVYVPVEDDGSDDYDDTLEEIIEETVADTTAATEEATPEGNDASIDEPADEGTPEDNSSENLD